MKTAQTRFATRIKTRNFLIATTLLATATASHAQANLTGVTFNNRDNLGTYWDTTGGNSGWNFYGSTTNGASFINPGNGATTGVNIPIIAGNTYDYRFFGDAVVGSTAGVLSLYFNGSTVPSLTAVVGRGAANTSFLPYSGTAKGMSDTTLAGANRVALALSGVTYTVQQYSYTESFGDRVSPYTATANGGNDTVVAFRLAATSAVAVPESSTLALFVLPLLGAIVRRFPITKGN